MTDRHPEFEQIADGIARYMAAVDTGYSPAYLDSLDQLLGEIAQQQQPKEEP